MSYMSSAFARVIDSVLPGGGGRTRLPSKRGGGTTFSVTGNAQSGLSAAAATAGRSPSATTPMTIFMTPPNLFFSFRSDRHPAVGRQSYAFTPYSIVKRVASDRFRGIALDAL